jgi:hypothetical protein
VPAGFVVAYAAVTLLLVPKNVLSAAAGLAAWPAAGRAGCATRILLS